MYWPTGTPRVYAACLPPSNLPDTPDTPDTPAVSTRASTDSTPPEPSVDGSEDENRKVGEKEVRDEDDTPPTATEDGCNDTIVTLRAARTGGLFATITGRELTIWQTKPTAVVSHVRRSQSSLASYGPNIDLLIRPDSQIFVVRTTLGYLMTYSLAFDASSRVYKPQLLNPSHHLRQAALSISRSAVSPSGLPIGAGEGHGVGEYSLQFRMVIKVDAGIQKVLALEEELMVATTKPAAVQCIRWTPDERGSQTSAELCARMGWLCKKVVVTDMVYDKPMNLSAWITSDGRAYSVQKVQHVSEGGRPGTFKGYCFHTPASTSEDATKVGINARFSMIAVACESGSIFVYNARDYNGNIPLSHKLQPPSKSAGKVTFVAWSPDGYCLFVGYENGWATWSVYGKPGSNSFLANRNAVERHQNEEYLLGVKEGCWIANGSEILLLASKGDDRIWSLEFAKSAVIGCFSCVNTARPLLHTNEQLFIYRGYDQDDVTMISHDASALWHTVQMPAVYLAQNWPIRMAVSSPDGRYVAVAGTKGLAHYSVNSGRWRTFASEQMEQEFVVRGGMCWYQHILIAAVESGESYELRLYSRENQLDNNLVLHTESLPAAVIFMSLTGDDSLLVYTYENTLYHFIIQSTETTVKLVQVGQITFHGIIRSPARVRSISWIVPDSQLREGDPSRDVAVATVLFLLDGKLVLLQPSATEEGELKYDMKVLHQNVEYYILMRDQPPLKPTLPAATQFGDSMQFPTEPPPDQPLADSLWFFDGKDMKVHPSALLPLQTTTPISIPLDFYPLSVLLHKAIILGLEPSLIARGALSFSYHKTQTRTHLLLAQLLRHLLTTHQHQSAVAMAQSYAHLPYFSHALEILLHSVLDDEADAVPAEPVLPAVISFLRSFPEVYLDVIVQCTRKTEVKSWRHLFDVVGSPQALFEESLERGLLKTAGGYLLVVQTLEGLEEGGKEVAVLLRMARERGEWGLCMELARFLVAVDNGGDVLRGVLGEVGMKS